MLPHPITPSLYPWTHRSPPSPLTHPTRIPLELRMRPTSTSRQMMTSSNSRPRYPSHLWTHSRKPGVDTGKEPGTCVFFGRILLFSPHWPGASNPLASAVPVFGLQLYTTKPDLMSVLEKDSASSHEFLL